MSGFALTVATEIMDKEALTQPDKGIYGNVLKILHNFFLY